MTVKSKTLQWNIADQKRWDKDPVKMFYAEFSARARRKGYVCLSLEELRVLMAPMTCARTGIPLKWDRNGRRGFNSPWGPSVDRIDSNSGYELSNVQVVCCIYNYAKNQYSDVDVEEMARWLLTRVK